MNKDQLQELALENISTSAQARSTPNKNQNKKKIKNEIDILDLFMSPDKPKSKLRLLAENSTKKYSSNKQQQQPSTSPPGVFLNLGIPSQPIVDPKTLFPSKSPSHRSSFRKSISPIKSTTKNHTSIDNLDILKPTKTKPMHNQNNNKISSRKSNRRSITIVHVSHHHQNSSLVDTINDPKDDDLPLTTERIENTHTEDGESTCSNDSFDPNVLVPKHETNHTVQVTQEEEEEDDDSIIKIPCKKSSKRTKQIIPIEESDDSEEETQDEKKKIPSSSTSKPSQSSASNVDGITKPNINNKNQRKTSLKANHSQQTSSNPTLNLNDSSSDDSIEILPSRAMQFQKLRAIALSTPNEELSAIYNPCDEESILDKKKSTTRLHVPGSSSKEKINKPIASTTSDTDKPIHSKIKELPKSKTKVQTTKEPTIVEPVQKKAEPMSKKAEAKKKAVPFSKIRDNLAKELVELLNNEVFNGKLPKEISIIWSKRLNTTAGRAKWTIIKDSNNHDLVIKEKVEIELAVKVIDNVFKLRNTLAHELCHVACWFIDRQKEEKHGKYFKAWASKINLNMSDIKVTTKHDYVINYKFNWKCCQPKCDKVYGRHSNSIDSNRHSCICGGKLIKLTPTSTSSKMDKTQDKPTNHNHNQHGILNDDDESLNDQFKNLVVSQDDSKLSFSHDLIQL